MKPSSTHIQIVVAMLVGAALLSVAFFVLHRERREFDRHVHVGMSTAELLEAVGKPNLDLKPGDTLESWGNGQERVVTESTWVYFVAPDSQHRFVVTLQDDRVVRIESNQN